MARSCACCRWRRLAACGLAVVALTVGPARAGGGLVAPEPSWSFGLRSTGYAFQTADDGGAKTDHLRFFEHFSGTASGLAGGALTFRAAGRFADTPAQAGPDRENARLSVGLAEARLGARLRVQAGRQFLQSGVAGLTFDGVRVAYHGTRLLEASAWGGAASPTGHTYELGQLDEDAAGGGRAVLRTGRTGRLGLSAAYRERFGVVAERPLGIDYTAALAPGVRALARASYDLEGDRWLRLEAQGRWRPAPGRPELNLQLMDRYPSVDAASWFSRFTDLERVRLARAGLRWENAARFGAEAEYVGAFVGGRTSNRVGLAALLPGARVGYSLRLGAAGDENAFYGEVGWRARPWLKLEGEASYLTYALFEDAPADQERDLTTLAARARVNLRSGLNVVAEVQSLDNPQYDKDVRFLVGVDLAMGRGASRFGLDRGGWLR